MMGWKCYDGYVGYTTGYRLLAWSMKSMGNMEICMGVGLVTWHFGIRGHDLFFTLFVSWLVLLWDAGFGLARHIGFDVSPRGEDVTSSLFSFAAQDIYQMESRPSPP